MEKVTDFESSNVLSIGYDDRTSILEVKFKNDQTYHYLDVTQNVWEDFKRAESKGIFLNRDIKGKFRYTRV